MLVCCVSCVCLNVVTEGGAIMDKLRGHLDLKSSLKEAETQFISQPGTQTPD